MKNALTRPMQLVMGLLLPLSVWAQTPPVLESVTEPPVLDAAISGVPASALAGCRAVTDQAMAADMKALTGQSQKLALAEQARLFEASTVLWTQTVAQCEGRARDRAQRNLADSQKMRASISEQQGVAPQCASAHKDAASLQDLARQALSERRWSDAAMLFRKAENMWDMASEHCTGSQQELASNRRDQSEIDGQNAEFCAPLFEKAREQTQKTRALAASLSRQDKQDALMVAETLWRDAIGQCKGAALDLARTNAQAQARERGTPWVSRVAPAPQLAASPSKSGALGASSAVLAQTSGTGAGASVGLVSALSSALSLQGHAATPSSLMTPETSTEATKPGALAELSDDGTRFSGQFVRDSDGPTYSGSGKVVWASGDVYEGTLVKGQRHGKGLFVWTNGQRYDGDWNHDKASGQARVQFANGNQFEGRVVEGIPQGQGQMRYASGDIYTGTLKDGEPEGVGLYLWKNGQQFDGTWKHSRPNGQGKLKFATGNQFEGSVQNGVPNGQGRMLFASGENYAGDFVNGQPDGQGTFNWPSGDQYTGQWKAGKKHGQGTFTWKSGDRWAGLYQDDVQISQ